MSKKIYVGLQDPRKRSLVARKTGISADTLKKAAEGRLKLSSSDLEKVAKALNVSEA